jgi:hypothetical protein
MPSPVVHTRHAARLVRQERLDGNPFIIGEFVTHDSKPQFGSLNHGPAAELNLASTFALLVATEGQSGTCLSRMDLGGWPAKSRRCIM